MTKQIKENDSDNEIVKQKATKEQIEEYNYNNEIVKLQRAKYKLELQRDIMRLELDIKRLEEM